MKRAVVVLLVLVLAALAGASVAYAANGELTLGEGLTWVLSGGGAGVVAFFLIDRVPFLAKLMPDYKRYVSIGLVLVLCGLAWGASMLLQYTPVPRDWIAWVEQGFSIGFVGITTSLLIHGATDLRKKRIALENGQQ